MPKAAKTPTQPALAAARASPSQDASPAVTATNAPAATASPAATATDAPAASPELDDGLSAYERQRLANIARNHARMAHLNLPTLAAEVAPPVAARPRGVAASRRRKAETEVLPPRKSLRSQGLNPDGVTIADEKAR